MVDYEARVVFEPEYRVAEAVRGLEEFDYVWLIWQFHLVKSEGGGRRSEVQDSAFHPPISDLNWSPTVRPPRLGGNRRVGVFATRSPFRPNSLGLSSVRLLRIEPGPVLVVSGADLVDGTPIYDIKPYIPYADSHPEARSGFAPEGDDRRLEVVMDVAGAKIPLKVQKALAEVLAHDPRPRYQGDPGRRYTMSFDRWEVAFTVDGKLLTVVNIMEKISPTVTKQP